MSDGKYDIILKELPESALLNAAETQEISKRMKDGVMVWVDIRVPARHSVIRGYAMQEWHDAAFRTRDDLNKLHAFVYHRIMDSNAPDEASYEYQNGRMLLIRATVCLDKNSADFDPKAYEEYRRTDDQDDGPQF